MPTPFKHKNYQIFDRRPADAHYYFYVPFGTAFLVFWDYTVFYPKSHGFPVPYIIYGVAVVVHICYFFFIRYWSPRYAILKEKGVLFSNFFSAVFLRFEEIEHLAKEEYERKEGKMYPKFVRFYFKRKTLLGKSILVALKQQDVEHKGEIFTAEEFLDNLLKGVL